MSEFIKTSTSFFLKELDITTKYTELSTLELKSKKQELIVDICKSTKSDLFVFGSQGKDYADLDYFKKTILVVIFKIISILITVNFGMNLNLYVNCGLPF